MPEYLSPGVYMEEFDSGARAIEGVSTSTASFLGKTERGPLKPRFITSFPEFTRVFGKWIKDSYLAYSIDGFFKNGGKRCFVARVANKREWELRDNFGAVIQTLNDDYIDIRAVGPGEWVRRLRVVVKTGTNYTDANHLFKLTVQYWESDENKLKNPDNPDWQENFDDLSAKEGDANYYENAINGVSNFIKTYPIKSESVSNKLLEYPNATPPAKTTQKEIKTVFWPLEKDSSGKGTLDVKKGNDVVLTIATRSTLSAAEQVFVAIKEATTKGQKGADLFNLEIFHLKQAITDSDVFTRKPAKVYENLKSIGNVDDPDHYQKKVSEIVKLTRVKEARPDNTAQHTVEFTDDIYNNDGFEVYLIKSDTPSDAELGKPIETTDYNREDDWEVKDNNGAVVETISPGLLGLSKISDISIVCAPDGDADTSKTIISHCEALKDRFAIYQSSMDSTLAGKISELRPFGDYKYAALYAPWVTVLDPLTNKPKHVPPSGFVAGIYARSDQERGVHKAPANEVISGIIGAYTAINTRTQDALNPFGVNCIRTFSGRGTMVWGARTNSSNPNWRYVNIKRLFIFISKSIERATQWAVFEPNNEKLWADVRATISQFLKGVWRTGALMGTTPEEAFFVRCDRATMTEDDIQNGRLVCVIGLATTKPAEFVIFRMTQTRAGATLEEL